MRVPRALLDRDDVAIVLPLVFFDLGQFLTFCQELSSCIKLCGFGALLSVEE